MMLIDSLFSEIVSRYEDGYRPLDISQFEWRVIHESFLVGKVKIELYHKSRPTLVFSETVDTAKFLDDYVANVALAFDSLLHQCCAALDIHLIEKGCE